MTGFSDHLALGNTPRRPLAWDVDSNGGKNAFGVSNLGHATLFELVPATKAVMATAVDITGSGAITLTANGSSVLSTSHPGNGSSIYLLDCERGVEIVSTANLTGVTFTLTGYDNYGKQLTATRTGPNNGTGAFLKAVRAIQSMTASGTANPTTVQTSNLFGLNLALNDRAYLAQAYFNGTSCETVTTADQTDPATGATGDVRGTILTGTAGTADGTRRLTVAQFVSDAQLGANTTTRPVAIYGVPQV